MKLIREVLQNGLRLITVPMASSKSATVMVMVGAGSRYETKQNNGISHFLEHMAFKGTKKRPSSVAISTLIDSVGGKWNAFTDREVTAFYIKSASEHIELSMDVLSDMLKNSLLDQNEINKEKGVILEEINMYEDVPMQKIDDFYKGLLYGDTPMGREIVGEKEIIKKINREDFLSYLQSLYSPKNMTVVVAGGIDTKKTKELVTGYFGTMKSFDTLRYDKVSENQKEPAVFLRSKKTEQAHIAIGFRTVALGSKERYSLSLLATILGGNMSSRMFSEVREKRGLAYYIRTYPMTYQDCGSMATYAGVDITRIDEAIKVILEEYEKVKNGKFSISSKELTKAKDFAKGHLVLELEDSRSVAAFYAEQEILEKEIKNPEEVIARVEKVSLEEVRGVAKKYFVSKGLNLAVIGNFDSRQRFENLLK
jgi:predicted Zn-dependent peptidase